MKTAKKALLLVLCAALLVGASVAGTLAYMTAKTDTVTNTFTVGNINLTLTETWNTDTDSDGTSDAWSAKLIPGTEVAKDPKVTVGKDGENCWVFVKVEETKPEGKQFSDYITYTIDKYDESTNTNGWKQLKNSDNNDVAGVYYREVSASTNDQSFYVLAGKGESELKNGYVSIPQTVNEEALKNINSKDFALSFTAYAIQKEGFENKPLEAWNAVQTAYTKTTNS